MNNRYLGLDLSLSSPGFAVIAVQDRKPYILESSHVKTDSRKTHGKRLFTIQNEMLRLYSAYYPFNAVIRERGFSRHQATTQALFKVVGVSDLTFSDEKDIEEIPPTTVKKIVAGDGKASKEDVEIAVRRLLRLDNYVFKTDDESDACAVVLAYLIREDLIDV
jgi:crossover junction endodeoxyribonuclease RuvC